MAKVDDSPHVSDPRRLALQFMPPGELRDGYLEYLDGLGAKTPGASPGEPARDPADLEHQPWPLRRYLIAAVGSVVFAYGTWAITSLL